MSTRRGLFALAMVVIFIASSGFPAGTTAQDACTIGDRFVALRDQIPDIVGDCLAEEALNPETGNIEQPTTGGKLIWLSAVNIASFTDGTMTWLLGPEGLVSRANDAPPFAWEVPAAADEPAAEGEPVAEPPPAGTPGPSTGLPRIGRIYWSLESDGKRRAETDQKVIKCCPTFYAFYDYYGITPPNRLSTYRMQNDAAYSRAGAGWTPRYPDGWAPVGAFNPGGRVSGTKFTLVVQINGQDSAWGHVFIE